MRSVLDDKELLGVTSSSKVRVVAPLPPMIPGYVAIAQSELSSIGIGEDMSICLFKSECQTDFARHLTVRGISAVIV